MDKQKDVAHGGLIEKRIVLLRGERVMLSTDLAALYGVEPRVLVQTVKRNRDRFPDDFMFQLTREELINLKSQIVISSWGGLRRASPYAFTEQGVAMLSSVLNSERAIQVNIEIMRAVVHLRRFIATNRNLARRLDRLEKKYDAQFKIVFDALRGESGVWRWGRQRGGDLVGSEGRRSTPDENVGTQIGAIAPDYGPALGVDFPESLWVLEQFFEDSPAHERADVPVDHGIVREVETQTKPLQGLDCANPDESHESVSAPDPAYSAWKCGG